MVRVRSTVTELRIIIAVTLVQASAVLTTLRTVNLTAAVPSGLVLVVVVIVVMVRILPTVQTNHLHTALRVTTTVTTSLVIRGKSLIIATMIITPTHVSSSIVATLTDRLKTRSVKV